MTLPAWHSATALHDRQAQPGGARPVAARAEEALEDALLQLGRDPGPSSATASTTSPLRRSTVAATAVPGGCGAARSPSGSAPCGAARRGRRRSRRPPAPTTEISCRRRPARARRGGLDDVAEVDGPVRRLAAGVGAGQQQQVGHQPAHAPARAQRRARRPRAAPRRASRRAARGWPARWSAACAARARRRRRTRAGAPAWPRSPCGIRRAHAASTPACSPARRPRRRPPAAARAAGSRVRSISRAASVSSAIGYIARRAAPGRRAGPAPCRRGRRGRGTAARGWRCRDVGDPPPVLHVHGDLHLGS